MSKINCLRTGVCALFLVTAGCGLLDVSDPTAIEDKDIANAEGAQMLRRSALASLYVAVGNGALYSGLIADEFLADTPFGGTNPDELIDRRQSLQFEILGSGNGYEVWAVTRIGAAGAIPQLRTYLSESVARPYIGQMFAVRGFATLRLAEDICPGFALNEVVNGTVVYGPALTTEQVFQQALAEFDSALVYVGDSVQFLKLASVGRARTLLGLGRFAEAAAAVAGVPSDYVANAEYNSTFSPYQPNPLFFGTSFLSRSVANQEGGNGLDFVSAGDPRVRTTQREFAADGVTPKYSIDQYPDQGAPIVMASGIEARLIQAEAALRANDPSTWLTALNQLRQAVALPDTTDPGTDAGRVDLLFRERAFWLYATGHRLGDLRRLIAYYGRGRETVFPTGNYRFGGSYGNATSLPFPSVSESRNPNVTQCTSR